MGEVKTPSKKPKTIVGQNGETYLYSGLIIPHMKKNAIA